MFGEVIRPPYPTRVTTAAMQHRMLLELYEWWSAQLPDAKAVIQKLPPEAYERFFPDITYPELLRVFTKNSVKVEPKFSSYLNVPVASMAMAHEAMRAIREQSDKLRGNHGERSDSADTALPRLNLLRDTQALLAVAFLSAELFEAREAAAARQHLIEYVKNLRGTLQTLQMYLKKVFVEGDESEFDMGLDEWFSPPSDEPDDN